MESRKPPGALVESRFDALVEFTAAGHREIAPVYLKDADTGLLAVYGSHGLYRLGIHADGRPVMLFAADPDDLHPAVHRDPDFREKFAPGFYIDPQEMDDIEVVEARRSRTHKRWGAQAITMHSYYQSESKTEYGFLRRVAEDMWFSRAIAYTLDPAWRGSERLTAEDGTGLYYLRCYTTAGKGAPFTDEDEKAIRARRTFAFASKKALIRPENAESLIREDFLKRAELVMRDMDPNKLGQLKGEPALASRLTPLETGLSAKTRHMAAHFGVRLVQGLYSTVRDLKAQVVVMGITKTVFLSAIKLLSQGWRAGLGQFITGLVQPVLNAVKRAKVMAGSNEDVGFSFWKPGRSLLTGNRHYCKLDPQQGRLIRYMSYDEAGIRPVRGTALQTDLPEDWAEDYLLGTLYSPHGSVAAQRRINDMDVLHVIEPNGLELYYLIGKKTVYAAYRPGYAQARAEPIPRPVQRLLKEKGATLRVTELADGTLHSEAVAPEEFEAALGREAALTQPMPKTPGLAYDLTALKKFNERAYAGTEPQGAVRKALSMAFNAAAGALRAVRIIGPAQEDEPGLTRQTLESHLADRVVVQGAIVREHPASYTGRAADPPPTARHG